MKRNLTTLFVSLLLLVCYTEAVAQDQRQIRPGMLEIIFEEVQDPPETMIPPLADDQGMIFLHIDDGFPEYMTPADVRQWLIDNMLVFRRLEILNRGALTVENPIRFRYRYGFLPGQQFASLDAEFRGNDYFEPSSNRINFYAQRITVLRIRVRQDRVPEIRLLTTRGTLKVQANESTFMMEYEDRGIPTIRRITSDAGEFELEMGEYELTFTKVGFTDIVKNVRIEPGQTLELDIEFESVITQRVIAQEMRPQVQEEVQRPILPDPEPELTPIIRNERRFLRFLMFSALTTASVYGGIYLYNDAFPVGESGAPLPNPPARPPQ